MADRGRMSGQAGRLASQRSDQGLRRVASGTGASEDVQSGADGFSKRHSQPDGHANSSQGYGRSRSVPPGLGGRERDDGSRSAHSNPRTIPFNDTPSKRKQSSFVRNLVKNQKYNIATFLPLVLHEQFKFFYNLYFLLVALSQLPRDLHRPSRLCSCRRTGKEAFDDYKRYLRDRAAKSALYSRLVQHSALTPCSYHASPFTFSSALPNATPTSNIGAGDLVFLEKNDRVPADILLLRTSDPSGTYFVRTGQLDGETGWKLRVAVERTRALQSDADLLEIEGDVYADPPTKDIHAFVGTLTFRQRTSGGGSRRGSLRRAFDGENMLWANTVLAAGNAVGIVVYTGRKTRAVMNTSQPGTKVGIFGHEINRLARILCAVTFALSVILVALNGFRGALASRQSRHGKTVYAHQITHDAEIPGTIFGTSTLSEELGRIEYLPSDKTGTLMQNKTELKKLHLGTMSYGVDLVDEVAHQLATALGESKTNAGPQLATGVTLATRGRRDLSSKVKDVALALGLCHNSDGSITYQASSPDEVAIVRSTESIGLTLSARDRTSITLCTTAGATLSYDVLEIFPFTSESKRTGMIVRDRQTGEIVFYQKGADVVMARIVAYNDRLEEECGNMAREGLRTLVMARKRLSERTWREPEEAYRDARVNLSDCNAASARVITEFLEHDLELLGVSGVEDKLQDDVKMTIELLRNAGIKIWMLTGDKIETATCIAI
ncbi:Putative aminophospholipid-translocase [Rhodotorula toruloides]